MKVKVYARISPSMRLDTSSTSLVELSTLANPHFQLVFGSEKTNSEVYRSTIGAELLPKFLHGYNASLIVFGEAESGKSRALGLHGDDDADGIVPLLLGDLFRSPNRPESARFHFSLYEIYSETFRDLLRVRSASASTAEALDVETNDPTRGNHVANLTRVELRDGGGDETIDAFRAGVERRRDEERETGRSRDATTIVASVTMTSQRGVVAIFNVFCLPGADRLIGSAEVARRRGGLHLNTSLLKFDELVANMTRPSTGRDRLAFYDGSKLTLLMDDALGGNCVTSALVTFKSHETSATSVSLRVSKQLAQIDNFPVENTREAQSLLTRYRMAMLNLKRRSIVGEVGAPSGPPELASRRGASGHLQAKDKAIRLEGDLFRLRERNERLEAHLTRLQAQQQDLIDSKAKKTEELVSSEEERLQLAQAVIDLQLEKNQLEKGRTEMTHELETQILKLKDELDVAQEEARRKEETSKRAETKFDELKVEHQDLRDEHLTLNANYLSMRDRLQAERKKNEELSIEMINLINARASLAKRVDELEKTPDEIDVTTTSRKVERFRATANKTTEIETEPAIDVTTTRGYDANPPFVGEEKTRESASLKNELSRVRRILEEMKRTVEKQSDELLTLGTVRSELEKEKYRLETQLSQLTDEFQERLKRYIYDVTNFASSFDGDQRHEPTLKSFVDAMFRDIRASFDFKVVELERRETAAKRAADDAARDRDRLEAAYLETKRQLSNLGMKPAEIPLGSSDSSRQVSDADHIISEQKQTIAELRRHLKRLEGAKDLTKLEPSSGSNENGWGHLTERLEDFTRTTQRALEVERAQLMVRCSVAEEELEKYREFVRTRLRRKRSEEKSFN